MTKNQVTLYAVPHSLYAGRARSYLIKAGVAYTERAANSPHFHEVVKPKAGGRNSLPTVELADGTVIRDGAAIIDYFEAQYGHPFSPSTSKQNVISRLFDVIGAEGLLRPAMHYRWNFDAENMDFLKYHFRMIVAPGDKNEVHAEKVIHAMRNVAGPSFGVQPHTRQIIEAVYLDQLRALDDHFAEQGYLLGGRPCIGDFGLIAPLFAHLGRDPVAVSLMQREAKRVYRWVERMNRFASDLGDYADQSETWLADDIIPESLISVLRAMAEDFVPETLAAAECINGWLEGQTELAPGTECARGVGMGSFELRGVEIQALAQPYRFYLLERFQSAYANLSKTDAFEMDNILTRAGMTDLLNVRLNRRIGRLNNLEVWL